MLCLDRVFHVGRTTEAVHHNDGASLGLDIARNQILRRVASGFDTRLVPVTAADLDLLFSEVDA